MTKAATAIAITRARAAGMEDVLERRVRQGLRLCPSRDAHARVPVGFEGEAYGFVSPRAIADTAKVKAFRDGVKSELRRR